MCSLPVEQHWNCLQKSHNWEDLKSYGWKHFITPKSLCVGEVPGIVHLRSLSSGLAVIENVIFWLSAWNEGREQPWQAIVPSLTPVTTLSAQEPWDSNQEADLASGYWEISEGTVTVRHTFPGGFPSVISRVLKSTHLHRLCFTDPLIESVCIVLRSRIPKIIKWSQCFCVF